MDPILGDALFETFQSVLIIALAWAFLRTYARVEQIARDRDDPE